MGRKNTTNLPREQTDYIDCLGQTFAWEMVFRATPGQNESIYHLWKDGPNLEETTMKTVSSFPSGIYRSPRIGRWREDKIKMVGLQ